MGTEYLGSGLTKDGADAFLDETYFDTLYPRQDGTGASGTWSISISGTASAAPWSGITGKPTTLGGYGITDAAPLSHVGSGGSAHSTAVASGAAGFMSGADKAKLDGIAAGADVSPTSFFLGTTSIALNRASGAQTVAGLSIGGNAATATTLQTPRTIAGVSFDGSANISIPFLGLSSIPTTLSGYGITDAAPLSHVGSGGTAHSVATGSVAGFMSASDKTKLDGVATNATANSSDATLLNRANHTGTQTASTISNFNTAVRTNRLDQMAAPTSAVSLNSQRLSNVADPTSAQDAATKNYVDNVAAGLDAKQSVRVATTANITLSGTQTIDGVAVVAGDRVLVKNQTTASQNGIYVCLAGAWSRSSDANVSSEVTSGMYVFVEEGTVNAATGWVLITQGAITLDTTGLTFAQFSGAGTYTAGTGLALTGSSFSLSSGVATPGTYRSVTVDTYGRVTSGTNPTTLSGYGITDAAPLASPTFTGTPAAPTAAADTNTTQLATTAFVLGQAGSATPAMNGTGSAGTSNRFARQDHVHPTDTSRVAVGATFFIGTTSIANNRASGAQTLTGVSIDGSAAQLGGQAGSFYQNAGNLNAGTLLDARLPNRLRESAQFNPTTDWNNALLNGWYRDTSGTAANAPDSGASVGFVQSYSSGNSYLTQTVWMISSTVANTRRWRRDCINSVWTAWYRVEKSEQELDARYAQVNGTGATGTWPVSISGSAATLTTARNIAGVPFNGSANIDIPFANLTSKPTTIAGYGITNAASASGIFYADQYGVLTSNDAATNTTNLNSLITTVIASGGGRIILPRGSIALNNLATITSASNVILEGQGRGFGGTILAFASATGNHIVFSGGNHCGIKSCMIRPSVRRTSGFAIRFENGVFYPIAEDLRLDYAYNGIEIFGSSEARVEAIFRYFYGTTGLLFTGSSSFTTFGGNARIGADNPYPINGNGPRKVYSNGLAVTAGDILYCPGNGFLYQVSRTGNLGATEPNTIGGTTPAEGWTSPITSGTAQLIFCSRQLNWIHIDNYANSCRIFHGTFLLNGYRGVIITNTAGTLESRPNWLYLHAVETDHTYWNGVEAYRGSGLYCSNCWFGSSFTGRGLLVDPGFTNDVSVDAGCRIMGNGKEGIWVGSTVENVRIIGATVEENGQNDASGTYPGIFFDGTKSFQVIGVKSSGARQSYGIHVHTGGDYYSLIGNVVRTNVTGGILNTPGTFAKRREVVGNIN